MPPPRFTSLLKSSCDACVTSKTKCSGEKPCTRCVTRGAACSYSLQRRRGPPPRLPSTLKDVAGDGNDDLQTTQHGKDEEEEEAPKFISHAGRRAWRVFFSAYSSAVRQGLDMSWFRVMLIRLRAHLRDVGPKGSAETLNAWMNKHHVILERTELHQPCGMAPEICVYCASHALVVTNKEPIPNTVTVPGTAAAPPPLGNIETLPSIIVHYSAHPCHFASSCFETNSLFVETFGLSGEELQGLTSWAGSGGMLPWGFDVFAAIFAHDSDVATFLHSLALKLHHAPSIPLQGGNDTIRQALVSTFADVIVVRDKNVTSSCLVRAMYEVTRHKSPECAEMRGTITFELVQTPTPTALQPPAKKIHTSVVAAGDDWLGSDLDLLPSFLDDEEDDGTFLQHLLDQTSSSGSG